MATKTLFTNPTVNPFELLQVEEQPAEKRVRTQPAKKVDDSQFPKETPAEKGQRRAKAKAEKDKEQDAIKKQQQNEAAEAALLGPNSGFQVQKGSQPKKPSEEKKKTVVSREQYETLAEKPAAEPRKFQNKANKTPLQAREGIVDRRPGQFRHHDRPRRDNQGENTHRPPRHEGFDKHSGGKTPNKHIPKRDGQGGANWGDAVQDWSKEKTTEATPLGTGNGWGDEKAPKPTTPLEEIATLPTGEPEEKVKVEDVRPPAWDEEEGFGKMTLDEYQAKIAAQKAKALAELTGVRQTRTVDQTVDLSKFSHKEVSDEKEKILEKEKKAEKKKQQRSGEKQVVVTDLLNVRTGGSGRGRGGAAGRGRGGDRPPRAEGENQQQQTERPATPKGERRGGYQGRGGGHKVPNSKQFPGLPAKQ